jgi:CheY-like chemotaxis protein
MTRFGARPRGAPPSLAGARVLVVEGYDDVRELYVHVLASGGADVRPASSAGEALGPPGEWQPHVVVTGVGLAEGDVFALADALRARDSRVRLVAVTTNVQRSAFERVLQHGFDACLPVPVSPVDLCWAVADALVGVH